MTTNRRVVVAALIATTTAVLLAIAAGTMRSQRPGTSPAGATPVDGGSGACRPTTYIASGDDSAVFPLRAALPGANGAVVVSGTVRTSTCAPAAGALIRFWAADSTGEYTDVSYGSVVSGADGSYRFETFMPGAYPGARAHIHVSTSVEGRAVRTEIHPEQSGASIALDLVPPTGSAPPTTMTQGTSDGAGTAQLP